MISAIVAVEKGQGIGFNGSMPWPVLSDDMAWFKKMTTNQVVIMGSATWRSLKKPLPNRINCVISRHGFIQADHCFRYPEAAITFCQYKYPEKEIFVIGGQQLYDSTMSEIRKLYVTEIDHNYTCDKFFNLDYVKQKFTLVKEHATFTDPVPYTIKEYTR